MIFMKRKFEKTCKMIMHKVIAASLACIMIITASVGAVAADISDFSDAQGHWAYDVLTRAVDDGILNGSGGKLSPNGTLTGAQMAVVLVRQTDSQRYDSAYPGTSQGDWYYMACAIAKYAGILPEDGSVPVDGAVTRAQVFAAFAEAFDLPEYNGAEDKKTYEPISDKSEETEETDVKKDENQDSENQDSDNANSDKNTVNQADGESSENTVSQTTDQGENSTDSEQSEKQTSNSDEKQASDSDKQATVSDTGEKQATAADTDKKQVSDTDEKQASDTDEKQVADSDEKQASDTDENQSSGKGETNTKLEKNTQYPILDQFYDSNCMTTTEMEAAARLVNAGVVTGNDKGLIRAAYSITRAEFVTMLYRAAAEAESYAAEKAEKKDNTTSDKKTDSSDVKIVLSADDVKINEPLSVKATIKVSGKDVLANLQWYYDEEALSDYHAENKNIADGTTSAFNKTLQFSRYMSRSHRVGFGIEYTDSKGDTVKLYKEKNVAVDNYSDAYYQKLEDDAAAEAARKAAEAAAAQNLLTEVSCVYRGNYTKAYNKDYTTQLKTDFVNGNGYSSKTDYLIWINLGTQKVNIFEGSTGKWKLLKTFRCASGAPSTPTPKGVTYITYKQTNWTTSSYTCRPIVRFYPGTGYAFHSMLYYPRSSVLKDSAMGYPASHGCIRMEDEGIWYIYNYMPAKTTVVVY